MPEMTPQEAAEILEKRMSRYHPSDAITAATALAVSYLRKIASGEYAPVVRCRDCKCYKDNTCMSTKVCNIGFPHRDSDDFCSQSERTNSQ